MKIIALEEHVATPLYIEKSPRRLTMLSRADKEKIAHGNAERVLRM